MDYSSKWSNDYSMVLTGSAVYHRYSPAGCGGGGGGGGGGCAGSCCCCNSSYIYISCCVRSFEYLGAIVSDECGAVVVVVKVGACLTSI